MNPASQNEIENSAIMWKQHDSWVPIVSSLVRPILKSNALSRIRARDTSNLYADDPDWLGLLEVELKSCAADELVFLLAEQLRKHRVRTFHGCRPTNIESYYKNGIRVHRRAELAAQVHALVMSDDRLKWMRNQIYERIEKFDSVIDEGATYLVLDDRPLIHDSGHYLIYGSEWIACVLGEGNRQPLLERGIPTLIEVELPLNTNPDQGNEDIAKHMLTAWVRYVAHRPAEPVRVDFSFKLQHGVPASMIVGHSHPAEIRDPWDKRRIYRVNSSLCPMCKHGQIPAPH